MPDQARAGPASIEFAVPGEPVPKGRPRLALRGNTYTPTRTAVAEKRVQGHFLVRFSGTVKPSAADFGVELAFHLKGVGRGDLDNYMKLVLDALNGIVWLDDRQVRVAHACLVRNSAMPRTEISIWLLEGAAGSGEA